MNRINPLHIIALVTVVFLFFTFKLNNAKDELLQMQESYKKTSNIAISIDGLKKAYKDKKRITKMLNHILSNSQLKKVQLKKEFKNSKVILKSDAINKQALNYLVGKLLNNSFNITILKIKNISDTKASLTVEIKW